jgi:hypothetical protein
MTRQCRSYYWATTAPEPRPASAICFFVATPTAKIYVPLARNENIPVVGLFTGAQLLYEQLKHYIINVWASYYDETRERIDKA